VNTLLNAFWQYAIDNAGKFPFDIPEDKEVEICRISGHTCESLVDVHDKLTGTYLVSIPSDPTFSGGGVNTGYFVSVSKNRITVSAASPEAADTISVTR